MNRLPPSLKRLLAGLTLCAAFLLMASIFVPDFSQAHERDPMPDELLLPVTDEPALPSLGTIENGQYRVHIHVGDDGPRYSVFRLDDGRQIASLLTADQIARRFPDLPIPTMDFIALPTLSSAETTEVPPQP